jgi:hypothetical protein
MKKNKKIQKNFRKTLDNNPEMCYNISTKRVATTAKESTSMKYVVEVIYGNRNEWSNEIEYYGDAVIHARELSRLAGVSETRVWYEEEIIDIFVDGEEYEEEVDEWAEYEDRWDEVGYDPYTGGFDPDL